MLHNCIEVKGDLIIADLPPWDNLCQHFETSVQLSSLLYTLSFCFVIISLGCITVLKGLVISKIGLKGEYFTGI